MDYIVYFYGIYTRNIEEIEKNLGDRVRTVEGLPPDNFDEYIDKSKGSYGLFIFDDLMDLVTNSKPMVELCTKHCQHNQISYLITMQNLFHAGTERVTLFRAAHILVLFRNPLDRSISFYLAARILPENRNLFMDIMTRATERKNGYLVVVGQQNTHPATKFRTDLFNKYQKVFVPKSLTSSVVRRM